jgi:hypothetical protein
LADEDPHGQAALYRCSSIDFTSLNFLSLYPKSLPIALAAALTLELLAQLSFHDLGKLDGSV